MSRTCSICPKPHYARGFCIIHYAKDWRHHGRLIQCVDCYRERCLYAKELCRGCYVYQRRHGTFYRDHPNQPVSDKYCLICLTLFHRHDHRVGGPALYCSRPCRDIMRKLRSFRNRLVVCQRCHRLRLIRSKCLCASCYVLARLELNQQGIYGQCSTRTNRFRGTPGYIQKQGTLT